VDIALLSMALSQGPVQQQASISVLKQAMGSAEQQGDSVQKLMSKTDAAMLQQAAQPHLGGNIDVKL
jgi:hypothetical protein